MTTIKKRRRPCRFLKVCFLLSAFLLLCAFVINLRVVQRGGEWIRLDFDADDSYDCILVLGAGLRDDGSPSDMLRDRLQRGVELYQLGLSETIVLSGDCSGEEYDEVTAMELYCLNAGIPAESIVRDDGGFSTFESMENLINEGKYQKIIVVTQKYHLYRAIFIAREFGLEADGYSADVRSYRGQSFRDLREIAARIKDFFGVSFSIVKS